MATSEASAIRAQEIRYFRGPPPSMALVIDLLSSRGGGELYEVYLIRTAHPHRYKSEINSDM
jgi:hypothetical protein